HIYRHLLGLFAMFIHFTASSLLYLVRLDIAKLQTLSFIQLSIDEEKEIQKFGKETYPSPTLLPYRFSTFASVLHPNHLSKLPKSSMPSHIPPFPMPSKTNQYLSGRLPASILLNPRTRKQRKEEV